MVEDLGENPPVLEPPVDCLVTRPYPSLYLLVLGQVAAVVGALYFVGVPDVPMVGLNSLARLWKVARNLVENYNVGILPVG